MIRYTKVPGLELGQVGNLPSIQFSEDGKRIGHIPGWNTLLTPSHIRNGEARNRVIANQYLPNLLGLSLTNDEFPNGALSFDRNTNGRLVGQTQINRDAWTFFSVVRINDTVESGGIELLRGNASDPAPSELRTPRIGFNSNAGSFVMYEGEDSLTDVARIADVGFRGRVALVMATYSAGNGVKLLDNGRVGAENAEWAGFEAHDTPGSYWFMSGFNSSRGAQVGHIGLLDVDLSLPENLGHRRALERYMSELYGISEIS